MNLKDQILENVRAMHRVAAKTQAAVNAVPQDPQGSDNGRASRPDLPNLTKPRHTTSYVLFVSVPEDMAPDISSYIDFLRRPGERANAVVMEALRDAAEAAGWEPAA